MDAGQEELQREIQELKQRVARLEARLAPTAAEPAPAAPTAAVAPPEVRPSPTESLETRIGSRIFNRVGIVAVLIAVAWFLKIAFDNRWLGAMGKVSAGIVGGLGLIAWSEWFHHHDYDAFSYSLKAVGAGLLYLSLWAAWTLFHLLPLPAAALAMVVVTAGIGLLAWARESQLLAFYAAVGGYLTPLLLSDGHNHETGLFGYLLLLSVAMLALAAVRPWPRLMLAAFCASAAYGVGWAAFYYSDAQFGRTLGFAVVFLLLFAAAPLVQRRSQIPLIVAILNAAFALTAAVLLFAVGTRAWASLALAVFYFALARVERRGAPVLIANCFLLAAESFGIHSFWQRAVGVSLADRAVDEAISYSAWFMVFGAVVLGVGFWRRSAALRWQGLIVLCIAIAKVFLVDMRTLSAGYRVLSFLGLGALLLAVSFVYQRDWLGLRSSPER